MPFTSGKLKGQLTAAEIRKLIRGHNKLVSIKIPPKTNRDGLIKLIEDNGYKLDHKKQMISDARKTRPRRQKITLDQAKELTKPKEKTALQKQKAKEKKEEKEIQKKKEVRQIKKEAVKKEKEVQKKKKKDIKDKLLSTDNNRKKKMPTISTQTETPKKKQVLKLPSQKPKKVTIDKSKKPPMNTKKIVPKKKVEPKKKEDEFKLDPNSNNSKAVQLAWFEYKKLLDANKTKLENMKIDKKHGEIIYKNEYDFFKSRYTPSQKNGTLWLKKLKAVLDEKTEKKEEPKKKEASKPISFRGNKYIANLFLDSTGGSTKDISMWKKIRELKNGDINKIVLSTSKAKAKIKKAILDGLKELKDDIDNKGKGIPYIKLTTKYDATEQAADLGLPAYDIGAEGEETLTPILHLLESLFNVKIKQPAKLNKNTMHELIKIIN